MRSTKRDNGAYDWSCMPCELVSAVLDHLSVVDRQRASSVCRTWRRAASFLDHPSPWLTKLPCLCTCLIRKLDCHCRDLKFYSLIRRTSYYFIISPHSHSQTSDSMWLIRTEDVEPNKWLLHNPCSWKYDYFDPPPGDYRFSFNLLDEHCIMDVATLFTLHHVSDLENCPLGKHGFSFTHLMPCVRKLVPFPDWTRFLLLCGTKGRLVLWSESNQWTFLVDTGGGGCQFDDVVYHQGNAYALDTSGSLFSIHPTRPHLTKIASSPLKLDGDVHVMHLVSSEECLYLVYSAHVIHPTEEPTWAKYSIMKKGPSWEEFRPLAVRRCRTPDEPKDVGVFVLNKQAQGWEWERLESFGDKVLFLANYCPFFVDAKDLGWNQGSFIYFMCRDFDNGPDFREFFHVYKLESYVATKLTVLPPQMTLHFWPPPSWLSPNSN